VTSAHDRVSILGVGISTLGMDETVGLLLDWASAARGPKDLRYVCATTVHGVMEARRDPSFRAILNEASLVTADGMPLVWVARTRGGRRAERVYGPDLMLRLCAASAGRAIRHYFYGGVAGVAERLAANLEQRFSGLRVAGWWSPSFHPLAEDELRDAAHRINSSGADIVWVGLGTPKQERWMAAMRSRLTAKVMLSVGAAFDFHAGRVRQAPRLLQRAGLEWAFRLSQEPRRLWRRYALNNPLFVVLAGLELLGVKRFPA
jgi:N-acetylglucosaminyldiphosphoundecaprenol N-acetyl-beta-D-mannosaminyltransferase